VFSYPDFLSDIQGVCDAPFKYGHGTHIMTNIVPISKIQTAQPRKSTWQVTQIPSDHTHVPQQFDFTCANCHNKTTVQLTNAVLKHMEMFCDKCGTGWKVSNPKVTGKSQKGV